MFFKGTHGVDGKPYLLRFIGFKIVVLKEICGGILSIDEKISYLGEDVHKI